MVVAYNFNNSNTFMGDIMNNLNLPLEIPDWVLAVFIILIFIGAYFLLWRVSRNDIPRDEEIWLEELKDTEKLWKWLG